MAALGLLVLPIRVVWLVSIVLNVYQVLGAEGALDGRWRALQVNCTISLQNQHAQVSVTEATVLFDDLELARTQRAQWLHDLGDWHLFQSGNVTRAEEFLRASADMGHATAQFLVGALTATGETPSPVESAVFYRFASRAGSVDASMALAYRHLVGYHAPQSCESALRYYKTVADDVMRHKHALPNRALPVQVFSIPAPVLLTDDQDKLPQTDQDERERVEYLRQRCASSSKVTLLVRTASLILFSDLYQEDSKVHANAQREAVGLLERAATLGSSSAMALLGHIHAYGLAGAPTDIPLAIQHYEKAFNSSSSDLGDDNGHAEAANGLGMVYLRGLEGNPSDVERAMSHFKIAAQLGHAEAVFHAADVMAQVNPLKSVEYLEASAGVGHVGAIFKLARIKEKQRFQRFQDRESGCEDIVKTYKQVAEHNQYGRALLKRAAEAFLRGRYEHALRLYRIAAELGYEVAEQNAAWLLERYVFSSLVDAVFHGHYDQLVKRGIAHKNVDAVVRVGDLEFTKGGYRSAMEHYLRALDWDPSHARALFSAGYMCQWGLGTIHNGRSLERARSYYTQAQQHEPLLAYALPLLIFSIDVELLIGSYISHVQSTIVEAAKTVVASFMPTTGPETKESEMIFDHTTITSDMPVHFVSAMAFDGVSSSVTVKTTPPPDMKGLTLEMLLWIEKTSKLVGQREAAQQVLLDWPHTLRVELVPHSDRTSWQVRMWGSASFESVLTLTQVALRARRWYKIALVVDAVKRSVSLVVDGQLADAGNLLVSFPSNLDRPLIFVGHSAGLSNGANSVSNVLHGKLVQYRIWGIALTQHQHSYQATSHEETASLWIDFHFHVRTNAMRDPAAQESESHVVDSRHHHHASEVSAHGVDLQMIRLPAQLR